MAEQATDQVISGSTSRNSIVFCTLVPKYLRSVPERGFPKLSSHNIEEKNRSLKILSGWRIFRENGARINETSLYNITRTYEPGTIVDGRMDTDV